MTYTARMLEHFNRPRNCGRLAAPTVEGRRGAPGQGNYMIVQLRIEAGRIADAAFQTYGCPGAIACGSAVTELAKGRMLEEAAGINRDEIDRFLGGLPLGKGHCADLAAGALADALGKVSRGG